MIGIEAISYCLGSDRLSNEALELENPQWNMARILERAGVRSRPIAAPHETSLDLGERAALALIKLIQPTDPPIDALIFCTQTPDHILPPNSAILHGRLGMPYNVMAFDIAHACSGFIYGLGIGRSLVQSAAARRVLLVTSDTYSRLLHPRDRSTRPIFGDGAAATLISDIYPSLRVVDMTFNTAGKQADRFIVRSGGARQPVDRQEGRVSIDSAGRVRSDEHVDMDGLGVLSFFTSVVPAAVKRLLERNAMPMDAVSLFVFHQASRLALDGLQRTLSIPADKMVIDLDQTGNLVSASIPVALDRALQGGRVRPGQFVVLCGFGVGLSWGTALLEYRGQASEQH